MPTYHVNKGFDHQSEPRPNIQLQNVKNGHSQTPAKGQQVDTGISNSYDIDDHRIPLLEVIQRYNTDLTKGLRNEQVDVNREQYGRNALIPPKKPWEIFIFAKCLVGGLCALLWGCAILSIGSFSSQYFYTTEISTDNLFLGISILIVIFVSASFEFYQEFKSDRIMQSFRNMVPRAATVTRHGLTIDIPVDELVVGDLVDVKYGDLIPADIRIVTCNHLKVDHSSLTGESEPQKRSDECTDENPMETKNMAFFSTNALEGHAKGIVVRTGPRTFMGQLASLATNLDSGPSPIQKEMSRFVMIMTVRSLVFGSTFFTIAMLMGYDWLDAVFFVIGIVVANVPEGLTVTFTMMLALTAMRMASINCLVKNIQSVETLGATSVICSDKTGTLTMNKMSVSHLWYNNDVLQADMQETVTGVQLQADDICFRALANVACLCSKAVFRSGDEGLPILKREVNGDASEAAILRYMEEIIGNVSRYREKYPKLMEIPFNSRDKYQVSIHNMQNPEDPRYLLVMKGAPEKIINFCNTILIGSTVRPITAYWRNQFEQQYTKFGEQGERVLGFCDCHLPADKYPVGYDFNPDDPIFLAEGSFRFVGLMAMIDPPRPAVPEAVSKCRKAGIKVVMVTGDHPVTAKAIARCVGILSEGNLTIEETAQRQSCTLDEINPATINAAVVTGAELQLLTNQELRNVLTNHTEIVFARTSPEQKYTIVEAFQNLGHIVASTGDGVNDSPALKKADIGVAMGISGTEVSKETADMVLMDDNFASIVAGVEQGRLIFDNLKKLICYNLADNIAEMYSVWVFIILGCPLPMGTIAMLLSVCCTDVYPAISITHEKAESDIMKLKPRDPNNKLVTTQLLSYTYGQTSLFELASGFFAYFVTMGYHGFLPWRLYNLNTDWTNRAINDLVDSYGQEWAYSSRVELGFTAQTAFFASIVLTQISNVIVCKTRRLSLFDQGMKNWTMNFAICIELGLMSFLVFTPYVNSAVNLRPLSWESFIPPMPFMIMMIFYDELRRFCIRHTKSGSWVHDEFYT